MAFSNRYPMPYSNESQRALTLLGSSQKSSSTPSSMMSIDSIPVEAILVTRLPTLLVTDNFVQGYIAVVNTELLCVTSDDLNRLASAMRARERFRAKSDYIVVLHNMRHKMATLFNILVGFNTKLIQMFYAATNERPAQRVLIDKDAYGHFLATLVFMYGDPLFCVVISGSPNFEPRQHFEGIQYRPQVQRL